ncbi:hypothetical protein ACFLSE_10000 [Bacteroidota bacterium]
MRYFLILLVILIGCKPSNHKSETINSETESVVEKHKPVEKETNPILDSLVLAGVIEHPDSADCKFGRNASQIKFIAKSRNSELNVRLCEFYYELNKNIDILAFYIYDCNTETIILRSEEASASYRIIDNNENFSILVGGHLPARNGEAIYQDFCIIEFYQQDSTVRMRKKFLYEAPRLSKIERDSIIFKFDLLENNQDYRNENIHLLDEMSVNLFIGAIGNDKEIVSLYERAMTSLGYDGALAEYFYELKYFYDLYKSN